MSRPRTDTVRRWTRRGVAGYVKDVDGRAYSFYSDSKKALKFAFDERNKDVCLDLHEKRVRAIILRSHGVRDDAGVQQLRTVTDLVAHYKAVRLAESTVGVLREFDNACRHYLAGCPQSLAEPEEIVRHFAARNTAPSKRFTKDTKNARPLSGGVRFNYLQKMRAMFAYGVAIGWMTRNPVDILGLPSRATGTHPIMPWEDARRAIEFLYEAARRRVEKDLARTDSSSTDVPALLGARPVSNATGLAALCAELILLTGMRSHEARELRIDQFRVDHIEIVGKGAAARPGEHPEAHRARKPRRIIPLIDTSTMPDTEMRRWQERLQDVIRRIHEQYRPNPLGYVFWLDRPKVGAPRHLTVGMLQSYWGVALERACGGNPHGYVIHSLRKTAEAYFENELQLDPWDIADIAGHSPATYVASYRKRRSARDVINSIRYHAVVDQAHAALTQAETAPENPEDNSPKLLASIDRAHPHTGRAIPRKNG